MQAVLAFLGSLFQPDEAKSLNVFEEKFVQLHDHYEKIKGSAEAQDVANFYTHYLPGKCEEIKGVLGESAFVRLYQSVGANIRVSGEPFNSAPAPGKFFTLAAKINSIIIDIRKANKTARRKTLIVVDALRNPFEATYFQDRYPSFYLVAVSCSEAERKARLRKLKFAEEEINSIDAKEYTVRDLGKR
jgi:hypothetical protein